MNNTVTLSALITRLAKVANTDINTSRRFLRSFFGAIEKEVAAGETVEIKGIGIFRRSDDPTFGTPGQLQFIPDRDFASEVNAPFAMFDAVELADGVTFDDDNAAPEPAPQPEPAPDPEPEPVAEPESTPAPEPEPEPEPAPTPAPTPAPEPKPEPKPAPKAPLRWPEDEEEDEEDDDNEEEIHHSDEYDDSNRRHGLPLWFWIVIALILATGGIAGYFAAVYDTPLPDATEEETLPADSIESPIEEIQVSELNDGATAEAKPAQEAGAQETPTPKPETPKPAETRPAPKPAAQAPVYDTVTVSLAKLAKKHYGNSNFWVFIYKANEDKLGNPDHINAGTKVLIPAKESFQGATIEETKAKAKALNKEIFNKYKR